METPLWTSLFKSTTKWTECSVRKSTCQIAFTTQMVSKMSSSRSAAMEINRCKIPKVTYLDLIIPNNIKYSLQQVHATLCLVKCRNFHLLKPVQAQTSTSQKHLSLTQKMESVMEWIPYLQISAFVSIPHLNRSKSAVGTTHSRRHQARWSKSCTSQNTLRSNKQSCSSPWNNQDAVMQLQNRTCLDQMT